MISAIIILVLLGLLDLMLFVACVELEKDRRIERNDNGNDSKRNGL